MPSAYCAEGGQPFDMAALCVCSLSATTPIPRHMVVSGMYGHIHNSTNLVLFHRHSAQSSTKCGWAGSAAAGRAAEAAHLANRHPILRCMCIYLWRRCGALVKRCVSQCGDIEHVAQSCVVPLCKVFHDFVELIHMADLCLWHDLVLVAQINDFLRRSNTACTRDVQLPCPPHTKISRACQAGAPPQCWASPTSCMVTGRGCSGLCR